MFQALTIAALAGYTIRGRPKGKGGACPKPGGLYDCLMAKLAEAHTSLAYTSIYHRDFPRAESEFERTTELNPPVSASAASVRRKNSVIAPISRGPIQSHRAGGSNSYRDAEHGHRESSFRMIACAFPFATTAKPRRHGFLYRKSPTTEEAPCKLGCESAMIFEYNANDYRAN